jgi:5'-3' exoribonuclease 2
MWNLSKALQHYVAERCNTHELWKNVTVIFSDSSVPGEGEHKVLDFIRSQRLAPGYDPNTRHCMYGADADLIMLGLSTHEPHFHIIREVFIDLKNSKCTMCGQNGHLVSTCPKALGSVSLSRTVSF